MFNSNNRSIIVNEDDKENKNHRHHNSNSKLVVFVVGSCRHISLFLVDSSFFILYTFS